MGKIPAVEDRYQRLYSGIGFERGGLFQLLRETLRPAEVLYPGCSVHLTPAFYFPQLVFVDQDPSVGEFFSRRAEILDFVRRRRVYRRSPDIRFFPQSFNDPIPVRRGAFDLVLALFTGGVAKSCHMYLRPGGILLTNNHHRDAEEASKIESLERIGLIVFRNGRYRFAEEEPHGKAGGFAAPEKTKRYLAPSGGGLRFRDEEVYHLFRKIVLRKPGGKAALRRPA